MLAGAALVLTILCGFGPIAWAEVEVPRSDANDPITITADRSTKWSQGGYDVWLLQGRCSVTQGYTTARGDEAVLWIKSETDPATQRNFVIAYFEGNAQVNYSRAGYPYEIRDSAWLGEFFANRPIEMRVPAPQGEPAVKPTVYYNGMARRDPQTAGAIRRTQFQPGSTVAQQLPSPATGPRRLRAFPRTSVNVQAQWFPDPMDPERRIAVITSGVNLIVDGLPDVGAIDISADRIVIWTRGSDPDLTGQTGSSNEVPLEVYMEGNIVFRQGDRIIHAEQMYYDVQRQAGTILGADVLTPLPNFQGLARLKADMVQQQGRDRFVAREAFVTTSRLGEPRYRLQANEVVFEDLQEPDINFFTGSPNVDPVTGQPRIKHQQLVTSRNNFVYLGPAPIAYWPVFSADLNDPAYYLRSLRVKNDYIFGTQVYTDFDLYQLLGITRRPEGTDWTVGFDYLSRRGFAFGTTFDYGRDDFFGVPGPVNGFVDFWGINDNATDRLGGALNDLPPEETFRYRVFGQHRQILAGGWQLSAELGAISDRNFLDQYFRRDWETQKDEITGLELRNQWENMSLSLTADVRLNKFYTQTERLPRLDHYWIGKSLLADMFTYSEHTFVSYERFRTLSTPLDAVQATEQVPLPWEVSAQGERLTTRHELDLPLQLGPVKIVPYVLGEFSHWGEDITNTDLNRLYGQTGIRTSLPFWTVDPTIESELFNVHGLAHKVVLESDFLFADANKDYTQLPLYDPIDDDAQEYFRRQAALRTFGGATPAQFDPRTYALRSGLGTSVTTPSNELVDDLMAIRFGARQRWQTKRGRPDQQRIIDWITLDIGNTFYPDPNRDNFGQVAGLTNYDARWHVGDRLTLLSNGQFDYFADGLKY
ncbi:MAG: LPS-assembly protein LptD, partial [Planctomycetaceae bacterium]|nr:LPS-assembly protein LptD [Planctomycetaceae bacterium]